MQIEIPDLDDEPLTQNYGPFSSSSLVHRRDGSSSSTHQSSSTAGFSFPNLTGSSNLSASRPFGGQNSHTTPIPLSRRPSATSSIPNSSGAIHEQPSSASFALRRNRSITHHSPLHPSPSSPSLNTAYHQTPPPTATRTTHRKLSVASLRSGINSKSTTNSDNSRSQQTRNPNDQPTNHSAVINQNPSGYSPMQAGTQNGISPRTRSDSKTANTTFSTGSAQIDYYPPLEVAVYLILDRFVEECESKLAQLLSKPIPASVEDDVYIPYCLGHGVDPAFDATFVSLAEVSRRKSSQVVNFVMRWKSRQGETNDDYAIQRALVTNGNSLNARRVAAVLSERKSLALVYILCRALISIVQVVTREALGEELGARLEEIIFNSIKNADPHVTSRTPNKQANMNMFAYLLGALSNIRFTSVSDRFAAEIDAMNRAAHLRDQKDGEARLGYLIRGVQFLKLKVYPLEAFEDTADFISAFATVFESSRGSFVKTTMAETLGPLLVQVVRSATAEVNHPVWGKAINLILNKSHSMSDKPSKSRYWNSTVPLMCAAVGAAPQEALLPKWIETVEWCITKLKEKSTRATMMLGIVQLTWSYLHRIREGASALNKRLEPILKTAFPTDRKNVYPSEVSLDTFASLIHIILYWQLDYGTDFVLRSLLTYANDANENNQGLVAQTGAERIMIGITGSLRALTSLEKGEDPPYPANDNHQSSKNSSNPHNTYDPNYARPADLPNDGQALKAELLEKPRIMAFVDAIGAKVLQMAAYCDRTLAPFTINEDKYLTPWHDNIASRLDVFDGPTVIKRHGAFAVEYPRHLQPTFDVLQTCLQAWPRILNSPASESASLAILLRGLVSLDVGVTIEAKLCLRRFLQAGKSFAVLQAYTRFLVKPDFMVRIKPHLQKGLDSKVENLVKFWVEALTGWCEHIRKASVNLEDPNLASSPSFGPDGTKLLCHMEATALVLLCSRSYYIRRSALDALRIIATARGIIQEAGSAATPRSSTFNPYCSVTSLLAEAEKRLFDNLNVDDFSSVERTRLVKWKKHRKSANGESLTRLLESDNHADNTLLCFALSSIFGTCLVHLPATVSHARTLLYGQLQRLYPLASDAAGVGGRSTVNGALNPGWDDRNLYMSWSSLLISVNSITTSTDAKTGTLSPTIDTGSNIALSSSARERNLSPGQDLIKTLVPFLTSDQPPFREATIRAMSSIHVSMYPTLLEGLSGLAHHLTSERKMIDAQKDRSARPNGTVKIIRLFSAIGKLHESTTKLLFHPDFCITERTIDILSNFTRETCIFLKSQQNVEDIVTISIRKSFLTFAERLLRKVATLRTSTNLEQGLKAQISQLFSKELFLDFYNLAEDWSTRAMSASQTQFSHGNQNPLYSTNSNFPTGNDSHPSRTGSFSSRVNVSTRSRASTSSNTISGDLLTASSTMIATLCESYLNVRVGSASQTRPDSNADRPRISVSRILRWIVMIFDKNDPKSHIQARRAFIGSVRNSSESDRLLEAALTLCWNESKSMPLQQTLFGVLGSALMSDPTLHIRDSALLVICLARLTHPDLTMRQQAIDLLKARGMLSTQQDLLSDVEVNLASAFAGQHLAAQVRTSATVCSLRKVDSAEFILELGPRIIQTDPQKSKPLARLMPNWLNQVQLPTYIPDSSSSKFRNLINVILLVTSKIIDSQPDEVRSIWTSLAHASPPNSKAIVTYLVEQTARRGLPAFVGLVRILLSCMSHDDATDSIQKDLMSLVEPTKLLAASAPPVSLTDPGPAGSSGSRSFDLEACFPALSSRTVCSPMQAVILLLGETMVLRPLTLADRLPHILHAYVVQVDHTNPPFRAQMQEGLVRFMGMLHRAQVSNNHSSSSLDHNSEREPWKSFWEFDDLGGSRRHRKGPPANMESLVHQISSLAAHLFPDFSRNWTQVAVEWATQCPVRHIACRSLQVVRVLGLPVDPTLLAELLVRLSNTASDPSQDIQLFALEVLTTYSDCAKIATGSSALSAQLFWTGVSCLETANDLEFLESIDLIRSVVKLIEPGHCYEIANSRPSHWEPDASPLRLLLMKGLRSSQLCAASWSLVKDLLDLPDNCGIIDWLNGGLALLYAACLPWCFHVLETGVMQYEIDEVALHVARIAESFRMEGLSRVMVSFAKNRFRTKEDFLRQAVNGIREYFLPNFSADILVAYLGLLCNPLEWLRLKTLAVLKLFLKAIEPTYSSSGISELGYDLLIPLLHLLQTNASQQALDILAEPMPIKARPLNSRKVFASNDDETSKAVFGIPDETGWCVPNPQEAMRITRTRLTDVIDTFATSFMSECLNRSSVVEFTYEWGHEADNSIDAQTQSDFAETNESFGDMVSTLHDLSDFFGQDGGNGCVLGSSSRISSPLNPSTARVAAILSRSLSKRRANRPSLHVKPSSGGSHRPEPSQAPPINHNSSSSLIGLSSTSSRPLSVISSSGSSSPRLKPATVEYPRHQSSLSIDSRDDYLMDRDDTPNEDDDDECDDDEDDDDEEEEDEEEEEDDEDDEEESQHRVSTGNVVGLLRSHHTSSQAADDLSTGAPFGADDSQSVFGFELDDDQH